MSRNIKEIGKELMGKSLNSFHRKLGLTQLEKNNEMQDGILDGILSQVDDTYIEKTEQSNVIHLDGSGDGVVVVDSIEGNTMVNAFKGFDIYKTNHFETISKTKLKMVGSGYYPTIYYKDYILKPNTKYTLIVNVDKLDISNKHGGWVLLRVGEEGNENIIVNNPTKTGLYVQTFTTPNVKQINNLETYMRPEMTSDNIIELSNMMILEGDWTNRELPPYFEDLQSSFEEKVNNEGKYEIEILSKNKNLLDIDYLEDLNNYIKNNRAYSSIPIKLKPNTTYTISLDKIGTPLSQIVLNVGYDIWESPQNHYILSNIFNVTNAQNNPKQVTFTTTNQSVYYLQYYENGHTTSNANMSQWFTRICNNIQLEEGNLKSIYAQPKQNKIKLLLDEPLRSGTTKKDRLCIFDNKLCIERNTKKLVLNGSRNWIIAGGHENICHARLPQRTIGEDVDLIAHNSLLKGHSDKLPLREHGIWNQDIEGLHTNNASDISNRDFFINIKRTTIGGNTNTLLKTYLSNNPIQLIVETYEPYYEEVLNEYGEPILLEGYENGTIYIDSTIVPTTSVRYTPKMESFKTLKEVNNNNIMLTNDVNDNIIPYMMDVDLMIMEKEMALMSHKNIRTIGVKDMTSMQKRTQDMLERLIKGRTLTEQECKTRVTTYLNAGKITDAQAEELMLLISEVYA